MKCNSQVQKQFTTKTVSVQNTTTTSSRIFCSRRKHCEMSPLQQSSLAPVHDSVAEYISVEYIKIVLSRVLLKQEPVLRTLYHVVVLQCQFITMYQVQQACNLVDIQYQKPFCSSPVQFQCMTVQQNKWVCNILKFISRIFCISSQYCDPSCLLQCQFMTVWDPGKKHTKDKSSWPDPPPGLSSNY